MRKHFESFFFERHGHHRGHRGPFGGGGRGNFFDRMTGGGLGGPGGMRAAKLLTSEDLQLIILSFLAEKPSHGYEIIKSLGERSSGFYTPSPGMIYPALTYLEEASLAISEMDGAKKIFRITDEGSASLKESKERVDTLLEQLGRYGEKMAYFQGQMAQEEATDEKWGGSPRDQDKKEWRQMKSEFHEIRHELKAALFEKLAAPLEEKKRVLDVLRKAIVEIRKK